MEELHEVAFRDTLGMSLYIPEHKIGSFNFVDLQEFSKEHQTAANMALVAVGMDPEEFAFQVQHRYGVKDPKPSVSNIIWRYKLKINKWWKLAVDGHQRTILPKFPKNRMKLKEFGTGGVSRAPFGAADDQL